VQCSIRLDVSDVGPIWWHAFLSRDVCVFAWTLSKQKARRICLLVIYLSGSCHVCIQVKNSRTLSKQPAGGTAASVEGT
jgi:hypothetical protein